jgi:hypothetical protein
MAFDTVATIFSDAAVELGLATAAVSDPYAASITDPNLIKLRWFVDRLGRTLVKQYDWSQLRASGTITTANGTANYNLPVDFKNLHNQTVWNTTTDLEVFGPLTPQQWTEASARGVRPAHQHFRLNAASRATIDIYPTPSSVQTIAFDYQSNYWVSATGAATTLSKTRPTVSSDVIWFDPPLFLLGLKLLYKRELGFDSTAAQQDFDEAIELARAENNAAPVLHIGAPAAELLDPSLPAGSWQT